MLFSESYCYDALRSKIEERPKNITDGKERKKLRMFTDKFGFFAFLRLVRTTWGQMIDFSPSDGHKPSFSLSLSPAPSRGLAIRGDSVQAGAVCPKSFSGDHSAEPVCFEY